MLEVRITKSADVIKGLRVRANGYVELYVREGTHTDRKGNTMSMTDLASAMTYGSADYPARPFLTDGVRERAAEIIKILKESMVWRFRGLTADVQYEYAANDIAREVRDFVRSGEYYGHVAPNAAYTIEQKGSDTPLVDTGSLVDHIEGRYVRT